MTDTVEDLHWISEARLLELCGLKRATWRAWAQEGVVEADPGGAYGEDDVLSTLLLKTLRDRLGVKAGSQAWNALKRSGGADSILRRARAPAELDRLDLVIEPDTRLVRVAEDDESLVAAVRFAEEPRTVTVVPVAERLRRGRDGFWVIAERGVRPTERRVGRPPKMRRESVVALRRHGSET
jgi:hypothetical protein